MRAEDINDEDSLRAWLETRPRADAVAIAHRAALRVFPVWAAAMETTWAQECRLCELPIAWAVTVSGVWISFQDDGAVFAAYAAADIAAIKAYAAAADADAADAAAAAHAARFDADAADAAYAADAPHAAVWRAVRCDFRALQAGRDCRALPLWPDGAPETLARAEEIFLARWSRSPETWDYWRRWWIGARDGKPLDWELQERVALIPPRDWERNDPAHIAALIRRIEDQFVL